MMMTRETNKYNFFRILFYPLTHRLSILRTLYFNMNYFPLRIALRFPVFIHRGVRFVSARGKVELNFSQIRAGSVRIGKQRYGFHTKYDCTIWEQLGGTVVFGSDVVIGKGTFFSIGRNAMLRFGDNASIGGNVKIICRKSIDIGDGTNIAWDVQIIDTDFHPTVNTVFKTMNCMDKPIVIGSHNWLCLGSVILKGSVTPDHCIVSANTTIKSDFSKAGENIVLDHKQGAEVTARYIRFDEQIPDDPEENRDSERSMNLHRKRSVRRKIANG